MSYEHHFDIFTKYCERCGQSCEDVVNDQLPCITAPNLIPISHIRAQERLDVLFKRFWKYR